MIIYTKQEDTKITIYKNNKIIYFKIYNGYLRYHTMTKNGMDTIYASGRIQYSIYLGILCAILAKRNFTFDILEKIENMHKTKYANIIKKYYKHSKLYYKIIRKRINNELIYLPEKTNFIGGIEYQKAKEDFKNICNI
jgi:hypothetical protein